MALIDWDKIWKTKGFSSEREMHIYYYCIRGMSAKAMSRMYSKIVPVADQTVNHRLNMLNFPKHPKGHREGMEISEQMKAWLAAEQRRAETAALPREALVNTGHRPWVREYREIRF